MRGVQRAGTGGMAAAAWGPARCCSPSPIACGVPEPPPPLALLCPARICFSPQVAMNDLSPAGPIQAVEIFMESPSLADMCRMHHAVIRRIQVPQTAGPCRSPRAPQLPPDTARGPQAKPMPWGQTLGAQLGAWGCFLWQMSPVSLRDEDRDPFGPRSLPKPWCGCHQSPGGTCGVVPSAPWVVPSAWPCRGRVGGSSCPRALCSQSCPPSRTPLPAGAGAGAGGAGLGPPRPPHAVPAPDPGQPRGEPQNLIPFPVPHFPAPPEAFQTPPPPRFPPRCC